MQFLTTAFVHVIKIVLVFLNHFLSSTTEILSIFSWSVRLKKLTIFLKNPKLEFNATYKFSFTVNSLKTLGI